MTFVDGTNREIGASSTPVINESKSTLCKNGLLYTMCSCCVYWHCTEHGQSKETFSNNF